MCWNWLRSVHNNSYEWGTTDWGVLQ
jgi:hypothetical protein